MGELLTIWTVRIALALYVFGAAGWLRCVHRRTSCLPARWLWTIGCVFFLVHVACAFHFFHDWSHAAAYRETAAVVEDAFGVAFGAGLYFNYVFTAFWLGDAAWVWLDFGGYLRRPRWVTAAVHSFMAFMVFNSTIVFEEGLLRWLGIVAALGLTILWWRESRAAK